MIALYFLSLIAIWLWLTRLLWKGGRRFLNSTFANRANRMALIVVVAALWFGFAFWEVGGKKLYWDARVRALCAMDGGIRVYETVRLTPDLLDQFGRINIPEKSKAEANDKYYYIKKTLYLRKNDPKILRMHTQVVRRNDEKLLGEIVRYGRGGGDLPGPWHPSNFTCPSPTEKPYLEPSIFIKGEIQ